MRPKVIIEYGSLWSYYQWFLLGFYELKKEGIIDFELKIPYKERFCLFFPNNFISRCLTRLFLNKKQEDNLNLGGKIIFSNEKTLSFCIDCLDAPFIFNYKDLKRVDCYFKMQCPKDLSTIDFALTDVVRCPWSAWEYSDESHTSRKIISEFQKYTHKIKPLMVGPRRLSYSCSYKCMKKAYNKSVNNINSKKSKFLMCYFGNAKGPVASPVEGSIDWNEESQIMGRYDNQLNHPNEKRFKVSEYISNYCERITDARVINLGNSDSVDNKINSQYIPYNEFTNHVSKFNYNMNVSGYRLSIPNRFIESFMVGTAIFTDKLAVKWYKSFQPDEVQETVQMGYLPMDKVDWDTFNRDLHNLPIPDKNNIIKSFYNNWSPIAVAQYVVNTLKNRIDKNKEVL